MGYAENGRFLDAYARLNKTLLGTYLPQNGESGVKCYLRSMENVQSEGQRNIAQWNIDYFRLKDYLIRRNKMAHGEFVSADFTQEDIDWIDAFRRRLLQGTDPISLLKKQNSQKPRPELTPTKPFYEGSRFSGTDPFGCGMICSIIAVVTVAIWLLVLLFR